jgi:hypothetical protein
MEDAHRDLEHDPEKWKPVFRKDHAQTKEAAQVWFNSVNQTWPADKAGQQKAKPR